MGKPKVAFICVHNSCRSQIAEALGKQLAADVFESYSAGTQTKPKINQDAVRLMKVSHGIDMEQAQYSKLLTELPAIDVVVTMGCNVQCPSLPCVHREDWGLDDPTGASDEVFLSTIFQIEDKILNLEEFQRFDLMFTSQKPLDFLLIMLGWNDLLQGNSVEAVAQQMESFLEQILRDRTQIVLIGPPLMRPGTWVMEEQLLKDCARLNIAYGAIAREQGIHFIGATDWNIEVTFDGVHYSEKGHQSFAKKLCLALSQLCSFGLQA